MATRPSQGKSVLLSVGLTWMESGLSSSPLVALFYKRLKGGAAERARTSDPRFTKAVLYQLSYGGEELIITLGQLVGRR